MATESEPLTPMLISATRFPMVALAVTLPRVLDQPQQGTQIEYCQIGKRDCSYASSSRSRWFSIDQSAANRLLFRLNPGSLCPDPCEPASTRRPTNFGVKQAIFARKTRNFTRNLKAFVRSHPYTSPFLLGLSPDVSQAGDRPSPKRRPVDRRIASFLPACIRTGSCLPSQQRWPAGVVR